MKKDPVFGMRGWKNSTVNIMWRSNCKMGIKKTSFLFKLRPSRAAGIYPQFE
jgi:hypothetical protein